MKCVVCERNPLYMELEIHGGWFKKRGAVKLISTVFVHPVNSSSAIESDFNGKHLKNPSNCCRSWGSCELSSSRMTYELR